LLLLILALFVAALFRLSTLIVSEPDEGTYVYAGRLVAEGNALYRDLMLAHPPLMMWFIAGVWKLVPGLMPVRVAYILLVCLAWIPFYGLARLASRSHLASLAAVALTACGALFAANMGRTVRLEPFMLALLFPGAWALFARPESRAWNAGAGALFALASLAKLTSIFPVGFFFIADLIWPFATQRVRRWSLVAAGAALVLVPTWLGLMQVPGCIEWIFRAQAARPSAAYGWRLYLLAEGFARFPPFLLGLGVSAVVLVRGASPRVKAFALAGIGTAFATAFLFKSYGRYYIVLAAPWSMLALAAMVEQLWPAARRGLLAKAWMTAIVAAGVLGPFAYSEVLDRFSAMHVLGPRQILPIVQSRKGFLLTPVPDFAFFAERDLYPWYYVVDWYLPLDLHRLSDAELAAAVDGSDTLVLYPGEFDALPLTKARIDSDFTKAYSDPNWEAWRRSRGIAHAPPAQLNGAPESMRLYR
jgi:hypothetical protein